jgi:hypothetical protein
LFCTSCKPEIVLPVLQIKSKQKQFHFCNLYKTRKSTKNWSSHFGLIEKTTDPSRILLAVRILTRYYCLDRLYGYLWWTLITATLLSKHGNSSSGITLVTRAVGAGWAFHPLPLLDFDRSVTLSQCNQGRQIMPTTLPHALPLLDFQTFLQLWSLLRLAGCSRLGQLSEK